MSADRDRLLRVLACIGLAIGGVFGLAGTFAPSAGLRGLAWGIDGLALVMAAALLTIVFYRRDELIVASGFLIFTVGEGLILSGAAQDLIASVPSFGAGAGLWALALLMISIPNMFSLPVRILGGLAGILFATTAAQIFAGVQLTPLASPLPFYAYPVFVATMAGWIWALMHSDDPLSSDG
jgi:hypothetical protein